MRKLSRLLLRSCVLLLFTPDAALSQPPWENACGDGRLGQILEDFEAFTPSDWPIFKSHPSIPDPTPTIVAGCHGNALALPYDLSGPGGVRPWIVLTKGLSGLTDLTTYTHIRIALRASSLLTHEGIDMKLKDDKGTLHSVHLPSLADLPAWKVIYIDFRELTGDGTLDRTAITGFELGIVRCDDPAQPSCEVPDRPQDAQPAAQHQGTLFLDEFAVVDLKPGAVHRQTQTRFEEVSSNPQVLTNAANALLNQANTSGAGILIPAWFPEDNPPNFNSYAQAEALLVFVHEYERTGNPAFRDAAVSLAARLIELQIPPLKRHDGAWYTAYSLAGAPPNKGDPAVPCDGEEATGSQIDGCMWVGNVGWVLMALGKLQRSGFYTDPPALDAAVRRGADWIARQSAERGDPEFPNLISFGLEGNISAYFGLLAAGRSHQAAPLGDAIFGFGWDPILRRMKPGVRPADAPTAIDVSGSWGAQFLRSRGQIQEALDSQGYSASIMRTCSFDCSPANAVRGYGDIAGPYTPAVEFTAQAAAAGIADATFVMQEMLELWSSGYPGAFEGAADHWYGGALAPWSTTMAGVSPTAWTYFAFHVDPLAEYVGDEVVMDFGSTFGAWIHHNGSFYSQLHSASPEEMAAGDLDGNGQADILLDFPGFGVWVWRNGHSWFQLHAMNVTAMETGDIDGNGQADVIMMFPGFGVWVWLNDSLWFQLHPSDAATLTAADIDGSGHADVIIDFGPAGLWAWMNNASWQQRHVLSSEEVAAGNIGGADWMDIVVDFPGWGVWILFDNTTWLQLHTTNVTVMATGDTDGNGQTDVILAFPGAGVWLWRNNSEWVQLHEFQAEDLLAADIDGNGQADVVIDFGALGLWVRVNETSWVQLHSSSPEGLAGGNLEVP